MALLPLLVPISNPDVFWHLSAARWIMEQGRLPREDILSFTMAGRPWIDFEWLTQIIFYAVHSLAGLWGLWLLKVALLVACAGVAAATLRLYAIPAGWLAAGLVVWSAGAMTFSDIRPDLVSLAFFSIQIFILEAWRLGKIRFGPGLAAGFFALFALWNNLHAGFIQGLALWACYIFAALAGYGGQPARLAIGAAASLAGSVINPYGLGPYRVLARHWLWRADLTRIIQEWQPIPFGNAYHWPFWPALILCFFLIWRRAGKKDLPLGLAAAVLGLGYGAASHARLSSYFNAAAVPLMFCLARDVGWLDRRRLRLLACAGPLYAAYLGWAMNSISWENVLSGRHIPLAAVEFMVREKEAVGGLRIYNPWEWGGYLGWRMGPGYRVFADGRYIFHDLLNEIYEEAAEYGKSRDFFKRHGVEAALLRNTDMRIPTTKRYSDGSTKEFLRPWYLFYMPRELWALVYWDRQALFFVDRGLADPKWLEAHEYRYVRPKDDEAFAEARNRREIPRQRVDEELRRHDKETALFSRGGRHVREK